MLPRSEGKSHVSNPTAAMRSSCLRKLLFRSATGMGPIPATGCRHCSKRNIYLWRRCDRPAAGDVVGQNDVSFAVTFEVCGVHSVSADTDRGPRRQRRLPPRPQLSAAARLARLSVPTALPRATHSLKPSLRSDSGLPP